MRFLAWFLLGLQLAIGLALAGPQSLLVTEQERKALFDMERGQNAGLVQASAPAGSLFFGSNAGSLFAPVERRSSSVPGLSAPITGPGKGMGVAGLRDLIAKAEAGKSGYDAVQYGARIKPSKAPTDMTIAEIYHWIDVTPRQPHAIGRYQFIPPTLRRLVKRAHLPATTRFSPAVQDQLADLLLADAGLSRFLTGELDQTGFMNNIAKIWAGLPNETGKSHYHGYAGNKAVISWEYFHREMTRMFPDARRRS
ncbi:hypothetical protein [Primorskyibacter sp. S187A]|uniref:hypothetical protein n=1 Tax=Primorskyibacter sp. S187A TaxID=3415130 RepID=UPI003C7BA68C